MNLNTFSVLSVLAVSAALFGCGSGDGPSGSRPGEMNATVNGQPWAATTVRCTECSDLPTPVVTCQGALEAGGHVQSILSFTFPPIHDAPVTVTYPVDPSANYIVQFQSHGDGKSYVLGTGELDVSRYDGVGGRLEGSFHFSLNEVLGGGDIEITAGVFEAPIEECPPEMGSAGQ